MAQKQGRPKTRKVRLTLQNLLKEDKPVWVKNNTGDPETGQEPGVVSLQVGTGDTVGRVVIPAGGEPVCITDQVDPQSLRGCRDLFMAIRQKGLELIDPDVAEEYYDQNEDRKEAMERKIDEYLTQKPKPKPEGFREHLNEGIKSTEVKINTKVQDLCRRAKATNISERDALERLIEQDKILTEADYHYILSQGGYDGVKRWARDKIDTLEKEAEEEQ